MNECKQRSAWELAEAEIGRRKQRIETRERELIQMWIQQFSAEIGNNVHPLPDKKRKSY